MGAACCHTSTLSVEQQASLNEVKTKYNLSSNLVAMIDKGFTRADKDGSSDVELEEFFTVLDLQDTKIARALFKTCDADNSGAVDIKEFAEAMAKIDTYDSEQRLDWTFSLYDADGGGSLSLEELHEHLNDANTALRFPFERLRQVFKRTTCADRSRITLAEFKKQAKRQQVLELPVKMIYAKVKAMIFDFDDGDDDKPTQFDARKEELVGADQDVSALTAMEGQVSLGGTLNGREF